MFHSRAGCITFDILKRYPTMSISPCLYFSATEALCSSLLAYFFLFGRALQFVVWDLFYFVPPWELPWIWKYLGDRSGGWIENVCGMPHKHLWFWRFGTGCRPTWSEGKSSLDVGTCHICSLQTNLLLLCLASSQWELWENIPERSQRRVLVVQKLGEASVRRGIWRHDSLWWDWMLESLCTWPGTDGSCWVPRLLLAKCSVQHWSLSLLGQYEQWQDSM